MSGMYKGNGRMPRPLMAEFGGVLKDETVKPAAYCVALTLEGRHVRIPEAVLHEALKEAQQYGQAVLQPKKELGGLPDDSPITLTLSEVNAAIGIIDDTYFKNRDPSPDPMGNLG